MSAEVNWEGIVDSVASAAIASTFQNPHGRSILAALAKAGESGLSFKELRRQLHLSPSSLDNALTNLAEGAVIENKLERREGSKDFSFYHTTELGQLVSSEIEGFFSVTRRRIIEHAQLPEIAHLRLTSPIIEAGMPKRGLYSRFTFLRTLEFASPISLERQESCHAIQHRQEHRWFEYGSKFSHAEHHEPPRVRINTEELLAP
jgi:DNA-binding MarR family transcriptional regulator